MKRQTFPEKAAEVLRAAVALERAYAALVVDTKASGQMSFTASAQRSGMSLAWVAVDNTDDGVGLQWPIVNGTIGTAQVLPEPKVRKKTSTRTGEVPSHNRLKDFPDGTSTSR